MVVTLEALKCDQTWITQFYLQITPCLPLLSSRRTSPPFGWHSFYYPTEGRRLSRPGWLVTYQNKVPPRAIYTWTIMLIGLMWFLLFFTVIHRHFSLGTSPFYPSSSVLFASLSLFLPCRKAAPEIHFNNLTQVGSRSEPCWALPKMHFCMFSAYEDLY